MKRKTGMIALMLTATAMWGKDMHVFDIKSGIVEYKVSGHSNIMGIESSTQGSKKLLFDRYGARSLTEENVFTRSNGMGQNTEDRIHTKTLMDGDTVYVADMVAKTLTKMPNVGAQMLRRQGKGKTMLQRGEAMMKEMGGKKVGKGKVLGYPCEIWELMGTKIYSYKGVPLKVETNQMGIKSLEVATSAKFNVRVPESAFKLPDYPLEQKAVAGKTPGASGNEMQMPSPEQMQQMMQMMQQMQKSMGRGQ